MKRKGKSGILKYIADTGKVPNQEDVFTTLQALESNEEKNKMTLREALEPIFFEQAKEEGREELVKALLSNGVDIKAIAQSTGQSVAEIQKLSSQR